MSECCILKLIIVTILNPQTKETKGYIGDSRWSVGRLVKCLTLLTVSKLSKWNLLPKLQSYAPFSKFLHFIYLFPMTSSRRGYLLYTLYSVVNHCLLFNFTLTWMLNYHAHSFSKSLQSIFVLTRELI